MFRKRKTYSKKLAAMRKAKEQIRLAGESPDYPAELPELRRRVIVIDYDFGKVVHRLDFYKTNRVDCYRVEADGKPWHSRIGWSRALAGLRKSFLRLGQPV